MLKPNELCRENMFVQEPSTFDFDLFKEGIKNVTKFEVLSLQLTAGTFLKIIHNYFVFKVTVDL